MKATFNIAFLLFSLHVCKAYKALVVSPSTSKSHAIVGSALVKHLVNDGAEVTLITVHKDLVTDQKVRIIDVSSILNLVTDDWIDIKLLLNNDNFKYKDKYFTRDLITTLSSIVIQHENVQKILNDLNEQFDVVVAEWIFTDIFSGLSTIFNCPLIWFCCLEINAEVINMVDNASPVVYSTNSMSHISTVTPFSMRERIIELWNRLEATFLSYKYFDQREVEAYDTLIAPLVRKQGREPPSYYDVKYNASLVIGNSHVSMGLALPIPQSYKSLGGYHVDDKVQLLPENLQIIMNSSKNGVIYFSLGSVMRSKDLPEIIKRDLLNLFADLNYTVLWKYEEKLLGAPKNVYTFDWVPQTSVLAHPKCILFITHGGFLSTIETIHYGVPLIGITSFGDTHSNMARVVHKGFGLKVDLSYNMVKDLKTAVNEMLSIPRYKEKVKEVSYIYHHRPVKPGVELAHWVRHVVTTRGGSHLRSPGLLMPLYQQLYLDFAVFLIVIVTSITSIIAVVFYVVCVKKRYRYKCKTKLN